jgi:hypothetical protein
MDEKEMALKLLSHKAQERMKHSLTGDWILSVDDVNEVLMIAGMPLIEKGV